MNDPLNLLLLAGGAFVASAPLSFLKRLLGIFLLGMVAYRHLGKQRSLRLPLRGFAVIGQQDLSKHLISLLYPRIELHALCPSVQKRLEL